MKLVVGKSYYTRQQLRPGVKTGLVIDPKEFKKYFPNSVDPRLYNDDGRFIAVYGIDTDRTTYALLHEDGCSSRFYLTEYDLVRPVGNILNQ